MLPPRAESATGSDCTAYRAVSAHPTPLPRPVATSTPFGDAAPGTLLPEALSGCALLLLDFVTYDEEAALLRGAAGARGWRDVAGRRSAKWGGTPAPGGAAFVAEPLPAFLARAVERADAAMRADVCAACAVGCKGVNHVLANEYQAGVGILPHKDGPCYLPFAAILSLGEGVAVMEFTKEVETDSSAAASPPRALVALPRRSLLVFHGEAYLAWLHGIDTCTGKRLSLTMRHAVGARRPKWAPKLAAAVR